jgi:phosphatidylserine/phosphatidylglycerophosphate/cardiolipin synthase-like enzyme
VALASSLLLCSTIEVADFAGGKIQAFVGPPELGAADDLEAIIVRFIDDAQESLDIAVQEIDSEIIAQAILDARWRGVSIRVFLEHSYLQTDLTADDIAEIGNGPERLTAQWVEPRPSPDFRTNRDILAAILRTDIEVHSDFNQEIFHQKFVIRDYRGSAHATSALLTGSTNFTSTDTHANLNHIVVFHDYHICADYKVEFDEMRRGSFGRQRLGTVPKTYNLGGIPVKVLFAPDHAPELEITKQINKCEQRLDFAIFTFSGSSGIDDALIMLKRAGMDVRGALDPGQGRFGWAATRWLDEAGVELFMPRQQAPFRKLHHKVMVIDAAVVVAGSFNYTGPANEYNDENIFVIGSPYADLPKSEGGPTDLAECAAIAAFFRAEIDRIIDDLSDPYA